MILFYVIRAFYSFVSDCYIELFFYKFTHPDHLLYNLEMYKVNTCTNVLKIAETQHDLLSIARIDDTMHINVLK